MSELPNPLVPAEVDLSDFKFLPLEVARLRDSDLASTENAEVFRSNVLSWCASWHQIPAGTLPDDDAQLARLLGYGRDVKAWRKLRSLGGLRGWILCADGRLHHPVVAEKANEAWASRMDNAAQKERWRAKKARQRGKTSGDNPGTEGGTVPSVPEDVPRDIALKGQGRDREREEEAAAPPARVVEPPPHDAAAAIIAAFDDALVAVFGEHRRRPWPIATDRTIALQWLDAGATPQWFSGFVRERLNAASTAARDPPRSLSFFRDAVAEALVANAPKPRREPTRNEIAR